MHMIAYPYLYENWSCSRMGLRYQSHKKIDYIHVLLVSKFTFILERPIILFLSKYTDTPLSPVCQYIFPEKDRLPV